MTVLQVDNVITLENAEDSDPIRIDAENIYINNAIIISMRYQPEGVLIGWVWTALKFLLKRTKEFNEAFREANQQ